MALEPFEFDVGDIHVRSQRLNALDQGKALKRILPLIPPLIALYQAVPNNAEAATPAEGEEKPVPTIAPVDVDKIVHLLGPFTESLSNLKDEDLEWLFHTCASTVSIQEGDKWVPVWNRTAKRWQYDNLNNISAMLNITVQVLKENLLPFFQDQLINLRRLGKMG